MSKDQQSPSAPLPRQAEPGAGRNRQVNARPPVSPAQYGRPPRPVAQRPPSAFAAPPPLSAPYSAPPGPRQQGSPPLWPSPPAAQSTSVASPTGAKPAKAGDTLTMSKVAAGGMAAATSAIFGSYFGAFGTVGGAALGSVATAVVTHVYQRSFERTQNKVVSTVKQVVGTDSGGAPAANTASTNRSLDQARTVRIDPGSQPTPKRKFPLKLVLGCVVVFILGMTLTTGIEAVKGSSVFGNNKGVSVSRIIHPAPATPTPDPDASRDDSSGDSGRSSGESDDTDKHGSVLDPLDLNSDKDSKNSDSDSDSDSSSGSSDRSKSNSDSDSDRGQGGLVGGLLGGQN